MKRSFICVVSLGSRQFVVHTGVGHVNLAFDDISSYPDLDFPLIPLQEPAYILILQPAYEDCAAAPCC